MLFKVNWLKHSNAPTIPKFYRTESNRTMIRKVILDKLKAWRDEGTPPPVPIEFDAVDVIPIGVLLDCVRMPAGHFQLVMQSKNFRQQLTIKVEAENAWGAIDKFDEPVSITIGPYHIKYYEPETDILLTNAIYRLVTPLDLPHMTPGAPLGHGQVMLGVHKLF